MLKTRDIPNVEILSVGTWHGTGCPPKGCEFTTQDLDEIVASYEATKDRLQPPLKLGHDDDQKLLQADGYPAAGWLANIRRQGAKLIADLMKVPAKVADLIDVGAYRNRSVELDSDYEVGGTTYPVVLTGMALLGADLPAVETLSDITALYAKKRLSVPERGRIVVFSEPRAAAFALPDGMSYDDLSQRIRSLFKDAMPGARSADDCWVMDLFDDYAVIALEGRYWRQPYTVDRRGEVALAGMPTEVQRVSEWQSVSASRDAGTTYADNAEHVLTDVQAFLERTSELAALRAKDGRSLSERHLERLASLRDGLSDVRTKLDELLAAKESGPPPPDYSQVMQARLRMAQLRAAEIAGVSR